MEDPIAKRSAEDAPTAEERELGARAGAHVRAHTSDFEEARRWEREEHSFEALLHAQRERAEAEAFWPWPDESADFFRMVSMRAAVLSEQARQSLHARGIGFAPLDPEDAELRDRWARRTVYVYWLLVDPASEWSGGPYRQEGLTRDRASAWEFTPQHERRLLVESVRKALDVLGAPALEAPRDELKPPAGEGGGAEVPEPRKRSELSAEVLDAAAAALKSEHPDWNRPRIASELGEWKQRLYEDEKIPKLKAVEERIRAEAAERRARLADLSHRGSLDERDDDE